MKLIHCFPLPTDNVGISYISLSIYKEQRKAGHDVSFVTPIIRRDAHNLNITEAMPLPFRLVPWKYMKTWALKRYAAKLISLAQPGVVFDLWSDHDPRLIRILKSQGAKVVKEKFNCAQKLAHKILSTEFAANNYVYTGITPESIHREMEQLEAADLIMSPSPMVKQSLIDVGVPEDKIASTSFGYDPNVLTAGGPDLSHLPKPIFLFVGTAEIRKGAHLLLKYWSEAKAKGTLVFMGAVKPELNKFVEQYKADNIVFLGHHEKAFGVYRKADAFVFPSLEEGGPLVTIEALARGLPVIASPMGAGAMRSECAVIEPHDAEGWRKMFSEPFFKHPGYMGAYKMPFVAEHRWILATQF